MSREALQHTVSRNILWPERRWEYSAVETVCKRASGCWETPIDGGLPGRERGEKPRRMTIPATAGARIVVTRDEATATGPSLKGTGSNG